MKGLLVTSCSGCLFEEGIPGTDGNVFVCNHPYFCDDDIGEHVIGDDRSITPDWCPLDDVFVRVKVRNVMKSAEMIVTSVGNPCIWADVDGKGESCISVEVKFE